MSVNNETIVDVLISQNLDSDAFYIVNRHEESGSHEIVSLRRAGEYWNLKEDYLHPDYHMLRTTSLGTMDEDTDLRLWLERFVTSHGDLLLDRLSRVQEAMA